MRRFLHRLWNTFRQARSEPELDRELSAHLRLLEDEYTCRGLSHQEAHRAARLAHGGVEHTKELHREARSFALIDDLKRDVRYALRTLAKSPGFTFAVIAILGIGIGANIAMFTVLNGVVLKPLEYPDADRIVRVQTRSTMTGRMPDAMPGGDEIDIRRLDSLFDALAYYHGGEMGIQVADRAEFDGVRFVHPDFFRVFGVPPLVGRIFSLEDAQQSAIVGAAFARSNFGTADAALGRSISIENRPYQIVGVMPNAMQYPANVQVWAADSVEPQNKNRSGYNYRIVAKLALGVSDEVAGSRLSALANQLASTYPDTNSKRTFVILPLHDSLIGNVTSTLYVMMGAVSFVLLIACANVASLMLARPLVRSREIAVRAALGARRRHLIGQLLAESMLLALVAAAIGIVITRLATATLLNIGTRYLPVPRIHEIHIDWRVLLFATAVSILTAIVFALMPIHEISRPDIRDAISRAGSRGSVGAGTSRMRSALVVTQIALSFALAINAGLLLRSFAALGDVSLGFRKDHLLVTYAHAPAGSSIFDQSGIENYLRAGQAIDDIVEHLRRVPDVAVVGAVMGLPTGQYDSSGAYAVEGKHGTTGDFRLLPQAGYRLSGPGYFQTIGMGLLRGRDFTNADVYGHTPVAIISEALAQKTFPSEDPIGHRIRWGLDLPVQWATIVGVVSDVRQYSPASTLDPQIYMPLQQHPYAANEVQILLRTASNPESLVPIVRETVRSVSPDIATKFTTMDASVSDSIAAPRFRTTLVSTFAAIALLLAAAGMYAVMSYTTAQRSSEFAVRLALGAEVKGIVGLVIRDAPRLVVIGIVLGLVFGAATNRIIATMLFGISTHDVITYAGVLLAMLPAILIAAAVPAIRAACVDPIGALRTD
jgi:putative ABC transport system permease protein